MPALPPVPLSFFESAPVRVTSHRLVKGAAADIGARFDDAHFWVDGLMLRSMTWTSPRPHGTHTTRTVEVGPIRVEEQFLAWEPTRVAFRLDYVSAPLVEAFAEDWSVVDAAPGHSVVRWTVALRLRGPARLLQPLVRVALRVAGWVALGHLARWLRARPA
jgi:hypothetical protein